MLKVCHITTVHSRYDVRIFLKECSSLFNAGLNVSLIVADGKGDECKNGINIFDIGTSSNNRFLRMTKTVFKAFSKAIRLNCSVYHFHDSELIPVGLILKIMGKKIIYDVHEDLPRQILSKEWIPNYFKRPLAFAVELFEGFSARWFDYIVAATPFITGRFILLNSRSANVNNYPLISELKTCKESPNKKRAICYIGGITEIRGIKELVKSLEKIDCTLLLAGEFSDIRLEQQLKLMPGWVKVDYHGFVGRQQIYSIFESSVAGVVTFLPVPNHVDAQPNKMFEYMSAGIPVIASNFPLWKEIIEGNNCGLCVNPEDTFAIAGAINYILEHKKEAALMGRNGKNAVEQKYNWANEEKKLLEVYSLISIS